MSRKNVLVIALVLIAIIVVIVLIVNGNKKKDTNQPKKEEYTIQKENGDKENTSSKLKEKRTELGYEFSNITLKKEGIQTIFKVDITNTEASTKKMQLVDVIFIDKSGNELSRIALMIREIKSKEKITTQATIDDDLTNVYDFKIEKRN